MRLKNNKYITRTISNNTNGFVVRLPVLDNECNIIPNEHLSKYFNVNYYNSVRGCLVDAIKYRDDYLKKHDLLYTLKQSVNLGATFTKQSANTSGIIGVVLRVHHKTYGSYEYYVGTWQEIEKGKSKTIRKLFSVIKYGEKGAFKLACKSRYIQCGELQIVNRKNIPCLPDVPYKIRGKK